MFKNALLGTIDSLLNSLGKFRSQLYSLKLRDESEPVVIAPDDKLLTEAEVAEYLNRSPRYVRSLKAAGVIPYFKHERRAYTKSSDLLKTVELNPSIVGKGARPISLDQRPFFYSKSVKVAPFMENFSIVNLSFFFWRCLIFIDSAKAFDPDFVDTACKSVIFQQHQVKPFPIWPYKSPAM